MQCYGRVRALWNMLGEVVCPRLVTGNHHFKLVLPPSSPGLGWCRGEWLQPLAGCSAALYFTGAIITNNTTVDQGQTLQSVLTLLYHVC